MFTEFTSSHSAHSITRRLCNNLLIKRHHCGNVLSLRRAATVLTGNTNFDGTESTKRGNIHWEKYVGHFELFVFTWTDFPPTILQCSKSVFETTGQQGRHPQITGHALWSPLRSLKSAVLSLFWPQPLQKTYIYLTHHTNQSTEQSMSQYRYYKSLFYDVIVPCTTYIIYRRMHIINYIRKWLHHGQFGHLS